MTVSGSEIIVKLQGSQVHGFIVRFERPTLISQNNNQQASNNNEIGESLIRDGKSDLPSNLLSDVRPINKSGPNYFIMKYDISTGNNFIFF